MGGGSLLERVQNDTKPLSPGKRISIALDIAVAMRHLHHELPKQRQIIHGTDDVGRPKF